MAMPLLPMARVVLETEALGSRSVKSTLSASSLHAVRQRQLKVMTSMCQLDPLTRRHPRNNSQRSSGLLWLSARPSTDRMVLKGCDPLMLRESKLRVLHKFHHVGKHIFTCCFTVGWRFMLQNARRLIRCMNLVQTHIQLAEDALGLLVPKHPKSLSMPQLPTLFSSGFVGTLDHRSTHCQCTTIGISVQH